MHHEIKCNSEMIPVGGMVRKCSPHAPQEQTQGYLELLIIREAHDITGAAISST